MTEIKPSYLVHGDDEVTLDNWRGRVRARVESDGAGATLEVLRGERLNGPALAEAIGALTLGVGSRWILADGVQGWKDKDVKPVVQALKDMGPDTVVVLLAQGKVDRRTGKGPAPAPLVKAVEKAGGEVRVCAAPSAPALPKWVLDQAKELGLSVTRDAAEALVALVGLGEKNRPQQQRLVRELEKIACFVPDGAEIDRETVEALTAPDVQPKVHEMASAMLAGDRDRALLLAEELRIQGEPTMHVIFGLLRRTMDTRRAWGLLEEGGSQKDVAAALKLPDWLVRPIVKEAAGADGERLERAVLELAELDWEVRGGGNLDEEAAVTLAVMRAAG